MSADTFSLSHTIVEADTAAAAGSEFVAAASTPFVLALAERACHNILEPSLAEDELTVGAKVEMSHDKPTPIGGILTAHATLLERRGSKASFDVQVIDNHGDTVAVVKHLRATVKRDLIEANLAAKR